MSNYSDDDAERYLYKYFQENSNRKEVDVCAISKKSHGRNLEMKSDYSGRRYRPKSRLYMYENRKREYSSPRKIGYY
jgi:hypothetical protein